MDLERAYEHQTLHNLKDEVIMKMLKVMVERGLIDEAARAVHDAGLGTTLKRIADRESGTALLVKQTPGDVKQTTPAATTATSSPLLASSGGAGP